MNIAIMAHDKKKELMVQFCIAYKGILEKHSLSATNTTGRLVAEATGLPITLYLSRAQGFRSSGFAICTMFPLPQIWPLRKC